MDPVSPTQSAVDCGKPYSDIDALVADFQTLLSDATLCETTIHFSDPPALPIPAAILSARSEYFSTLLSPRWAPAASFCKPNASPPVFRHLLDFLVTGSITLSLTSASIPHNLALAALAHELLLPDLETTLATHFASHLTVGNLPLYLRAAQARAPPPPFLEDLLVAFVARHADHLAPAVAEAPHDLFATLWRLLANAHAVHVLPPRALSAVVRAITAYKTVHRAQLLRAADILGALPHADQHALRALLLAAPPLTVFHAVEPHALLTEDELLRKYLADALLPRPQPAEAPRHRFRLLCESPHPHHLGARLHKTVRHVVLRTDGARLWDSLLLFDRRCSLGAGSELAIYTSDPRLGAHPHTFLVGSRLAAELVVPGSEFWYAFASPDPHPDDDDDDCEATQARWGWRFFVEPVQPKIDGVD